MEMDTETPRLDTILAAITRYVNTASEGGDGTTNGESGATAAYLSLSAWEAAEDGANLTTTPDIHTVLCGVGSGTAADTTAVTVAGWTTDATGYIIIKANPADTGGDQSAQMPWSTSIYRLDYTGASAATIVFNIGQAYTKVMALQFRFTKTDGVSQYGQGVYVANVAGVKVSRCHSVSRSNVTGTWNGGFNNFGSVATYVCFENCVATYQAPLGSGKTSFIGFLCFANGTGANNCTAANPSYDCAELNVGFVAQGSGVTATYTNCLAEIKGTSTGTKADFLARLAGTLAGNYNASSDATAPGANSLINKTFTFVSATDFHLSAADVSGALTGGVDLSGTFTDDFDADTRVDWGIGADEVLSSGALLLRRRRSSLGVTA